MRDPGREPAGCHQGQDRADIDQSEGDNSARCPSAVAGLGGARGAEHAEHDHRRLLHEARGKTELLHDTFRLLSGDHLAGTSARH
jgi:hypothetical protein